ncbi:MAG: ABC transporter ATP-binding protein [Candidatus Krumholzibacteria bacterium]|nr:ABC transporter ATP-binding protein [Candidatus Krumholzibacteria bacterium]
MSRADKPLIRIEDIEVSYGNSPVVSGLSTAIEAGTLVGLIGPNGAGKTTLMLSAAGQFRPVRGHVYFEGSDVYEHNRAFKKNVGYVHEDPFFYPYLTAEEFLRFVAEVKSVPEDDVEGQIHSLLKLVDLWEERAKVTSALSMGMRKKLAIAAAMAGKPRILFLDEALNGIDIESSYRIKRSLRDFAAAGGAVILSTHTLEVVEKLCDRYLLLKKGRIIADLKADEFTGQGGVGEGGSLERHVIQVLSDPDDVDLR